MLFHDQKTGDKPSATRGSVIVKNVRETKNRQVTLAIPAVLVSVVRGRQCVGYIPTSQEPARYTLRALSLRTWKRNTFSLHQVADGLPPGAAMYQPGMVHPIVEHLRLCHG